MIASDLQLHSRPCFTHSPSLRGLGGGCLFEEASESWVCVRGEVYNQ